MTQDEHTQHAVVVYGKLQSLLHDVERMLESKVKREMKNRLTNFQIWAEKTLEDTTSLFDGPGSEAFTEYTTKLDQISIEFKVIISDDARL